MDHGGTLPADDIHPVPGEDDTVVNPVVPAARPGQDSATRSARFGSVRSRGGAHRRAGEDEETASRGHRPFGRRAYLLAVAAAVVVALLAAAKLTIASTVGPVTVADPYGPTATLAPAPGGGATDGFGESPSATPGASNTALPGSGSPAATPTPTRASASASRPTGSPPGAASPVWTTLTVTATKALLRGNSVQTNRTTLSMKLDGNLAIIDENGVTRWTSGTAGPGNQATFQSDGNFVVYDASARPLWSSRTDHHNGAVLVLQANGDVCVVDHGVSVWCAGTAH
jgi:hypothetical protein